MIPTSAASHVQLSPLNRADGSVTYTHQGYTIVGAANGPIEVQRRDELPEEATVDVTVRPATGVGGELSYELLVIRKPVDRQLLYEKRS